MRKIVVFMMVSLDGVMQAPGGVMFKAEDPKALSAWYKKHLGAELPRR
jgi:hypothetical protein